MSIHLNPISDDKQLRRVLGNFATGVIVVTTTDEWGAPVGIVINSFNSVSLNPALVLWSLSNSSSSAESFLRSSRFCINILAETQVHLLRSFSRPRAERFNGVNYLELEDGLPVLTGCLANLICKTARRYPEGDHTILVGEVSSVHDSIERPLVYFRGQCAELLDKLTSASAP